MYDHFIRFKSQSDLCVPSPYTLVVTMYIGWPAWNESGLCMWPNLSSGLGGMPKSPVRSLRLTSSIWRCTGMQLVIINNDGLFIQFHLQPKNKKWNHTNLNELTSYFSSKRGSQKFIDILSKEFLRPYPLNYYCLLWIPTHFSKLKTYLIYLFKSPLLSSQHKQRGWKIFTVEKISFLHHLCIFIQHNS